MRQEQESGRMLHIKVWNRSSGSLRQACVVVPDLTESVGERWKAWRKHMVYF
jgi:hypothetical protein